MLHRPYGIRQQGHSRLAGQITVKAHFISPGSPWKNGYNESIDERPWDECLYMEFFNTHMDVKC